MVIHTVTKEQIVHTLDDRPSESLREVQQFLDFLRWKTAHLCLVTAAL